MIDFTVEEINLVAIYKTDTRAATLARITDALPDLEDEDIITIAESAVVKLRAISDGDFTAAQFSPADEDEGE
jgi:hypothetical protein